MTLGLGVGGEPVVIYGGDAAGVAAGFFVRERLEAQLLELGGAERETRGPGYFRRRKRVHDTGPRRGRRRRSNIQG